MINSSLLFHFGSAIVLTILVFLLVRKQNQLQFLQALTITGKKKAAKPEAFLQQFCDLLEIRFECGQTPPSQLVAIDGPAILKAHLEFSIKKMIYDDRGSLTVVCAKPMDQANLAAAFNHKLPIDIKTPI